MAVGIPSSNPAYSLSSVLDAQLRGLTQPGSTPPPAPAPAPTPAPTAAAPSGLATYNNLSTTGASPVGGNAADLATSTTASALTAGGSVSLHVVNGSAAQLTFTNGTTGEQSVIGTASAGLTTNVNGSNVTAGNLSTNDVGVYASKQGEPTTPGTANPAITVQSGATQGSTTSPGVTGDQAQQVSLTALSRANTDSGNLSSYLSQYA